MPWNSEKSKFTSCSGSVDAFFSLLLACTSIMVKNTLRWTLNTVQISEMIFFPIFQSNSRSNLAHFHHPTSISINLFAEFVHSFSVSFLCVRNQTISVTKSLPLKIHAEPFHWKDEYLQRYHDFDVCWIEKKRIGQEKNNQIERYLQAKSEKRKKLNFSQFYKGSNFVVIKKMNRYVYHAIC